LKEEMTMLMMVMLITIMLSLRELELTNLLTLSLIALWVNGRSYQILVQMI